MPDKPLKVGLAGLGTVGAALARLIAARRDDFAARTGRTPEIVAYSARSAGDRGLPLDGAAFFADAAEMAASADIDVFVELIGGADGRGLTPRSRRRCRAAFPSSPPTRRCWPRTGSNSPRWPSAPASASPMRRRSAAACRSSRRCARRSPATASIASAASSTAPAITSSRGWRPSGCRSTSA